MKLTSTSRFFGVVGLGCLALTGAANAAEPGPYFAIGAGLNIMERVEVTAGPAVDLNPGFRFDATIGYKFWSDDKIAVAGEIEGGFLYNEIDKVTTLTPSGRRGPFATASGEYWQIPFLANIVFTFQPDSKWRPYIGVGGGGVYSDLTVNGAQGTETDPAFQAQAGVKYKLTDMSEIGVGYKLLMTFPEGINHIINHSLSFLYAVEF